MSKFQFAIVGIIGMASLQTHAVNISFGESTGVGLDDNRVQIYKIRVDTEIVNPFDPSRPQIYSVYYDVPFRFDPTTLHLVPDLTGATVTGGGGDPNRLCVNLTVVVNNAFDGVPIGNANLTVGEQTLTTNSEGYATFTGLPAGVITIGASVANFSGDQVTRELACGDNSLGIALNPIVGTGTMTTSQVRIILTWGENPVDLDAHLTGPQPGLETTDINEADRFHIFYSNAISSDEIANLDVDDMSSYGPETITISPTGGFGVTTGGRGFGVTSGFGATFLRPGVYRYSVHHYHGYGKMSDARVKLILNDSDTRSFTPDASQLIGDGNVWGDVWTVFELNVNDSGQVSVLPVDSYSQTTSGLVRSGQHGYGEAESVRIMGIPKK